MFDRLFDFLASVIGYFQFACTVDPFEGGLVLRLGKYSRTLDCGWHFYWPLGIERVLTINTAYDTMDLGVQSVTTIDGDSVVLSAYVSYTIFDVKRALLDCDGAESILGDVIPGCIEDASRRATWDEIRTDAFRNGIKSNAQRMARKWGVSVKNVRFSDCTRSKSLRLFGGVS